MHFPNCPPDVCGGGYIDSNCVIYHLFGQIPTKLINLGLPNKSSAQTIFEAIDKYLGVLAGNIGPITPVSTNAISFTGAGPGNRILTPTLVLASGTTQIASVLPTGLFVPDVRDWKVKINATDFPGYLNDKLIGGIDPSGIVSITTEVDPEGPNLVGILPDINVVALANNAAFDAALAGNETFLNDLANSSFFKNALVSPNAGNIIEALSNGLYASGTTSTSFTINNNVAGNVITANGNPNSADGQPTLTYLNGMLSAPMFNYAFQVVSSQEFDRGLFSTQLLLNSANFGVKASNISGSHGQLFYNAGMNTTFGRGHFIGGDLGELVLNSSGSTSTTGLVAAVIGKIDVFNSDNYSDVASIRTSYPGTDVVFGGNYSGTITNYYGIFIGDTNGNEGGISHTRVTNGYAIFQEGSSLLNSFATAVVVTSDERVKTNVENFPTGLSAIENINVVKFNFKEDITAPKKIGVLAQQVETVLPEAIHTSKSDFYKIDDFKRLDNDVLVYTLINAVKELSAQNRSLNGRLLKVEGEYEKS
jgi:hypothetical protein